MTTNARDFLREARETYVRANAAALRWMLDRPRLHNAFLNTKQDSLTLRDYDVSDGWRGPDVLYGWIQGRGLEALVCHARFFSREEPTLAARLDAAAVALFRALADLHDRHGRAYFSYGPDLEPIYPGPDGERLPQSAPGEISTYSDIFVLKGLLAAATQFDPERTARYLGELGKVVCAIEEGRFVMAERQRLRPATTDREEYGPRMIMLGAAALLHELGLPGEASFARRFIDHVLRRHRAHAGGNLPRGILSDAVGGDACDPGHAIEFVGFALGVLREDGDAALVTELEEVLIASFGLGHLKPGIALSVSLSGAPPSPYRPWWSLPEAVRAAALAYARTGHRASLEIWQAAHADFFANYWRSDPPIAYQTRTATGPVDYVPATPDLDPAYHTGLSFLGAINAIDRLTGDRSSRIP